MTFDDVPSARIVLARAHTSRIRRFERPLRSTSRSSSERTGTTGRVVAATKHMQFSRVLCPIDFSTGSEHAMRHAVRIACETGASLVLAHSWFFPPIAAPLVFPFPGALLEGIIDDSQRMLDAAVKVASDAGAQTTGTLLSGPPWVRIVEELEVNAYDLCVIGTHGRTGLARVFLGSVAEMVVRHAPCAVMTVGAEGEVAPFRHVLVPTDFSVSARNALELAVTMVEPTATITLLHVIELPAVYPGGSLAEVTGEIDKHATVALDQEIARIQRSTRVRVTARSRVGYPGAQTLGVLDDDRTIDLVVMGSRGRTGFARAFLGSVAEKVVRHSHCPVLVARTRAGLGDTI